MHSMSNGEYFYGEKQSRTGEREYQEKGGLVLNRVGMDVSPMRHLYRDLKKIKKQSRGTPEERVLQVQGKVLGWEGVGVPEEEQRGWNRVQGERGKTAKVQGRVVMGLDHEKH